MLLDYQWTSLTRAGPLTRLCFVPLAFICGTGKTLEKIWDLTGSGSKINLLDLENVGFNWMSINETSLTWCAWKEGAQQRQAALPEVRLAKLGLSEFPEFCWVSTTQRRLKKIWHRKEGIVEPDCGNRRPAAEVLRNFSHRNSRYFWHKCHTAFFQNSCTAFKDQAWEAGPVSQLLESLSSWTAEWAVVKLPAASQAELRVSILS